MKPGNLEGGFWRRYKGILGPSPPIFAYWPPQNLPQNSQVSLSTPGLFHTLDIHTELYAKVDLYGELLTQGGGGGFSWH